MKIKINKTVKVNFRKDSARDLYYQRLVKFNGKSLADFIKDVEKTPPSCPKRGKLAGKPEPVAGWVSFFQRGGWIELSDK